MAVFRIEEGRFCSVVSIENENVFAAYKQTRKPSKIVIYDCTNFSKLKTIQVYCDVTIFGQLLVDNNCFLLNVTNLVSNAREVRIFNKEGDELLYQNWTIPKCYPGNTFFLVHVDVSVLMVDCKADEIFSQKRSKRSRKFPIVLQQENIWHSVIVPKKNLCADP